MMISRVALAAAVALGLLAASLATDAQQPGKRYRIGELETGAVRARGDPAQGVRCGRAR